MIIHLVQYGSMVLRWVYLLKLRHIGWALPSMHIISAVLLLLISCLVRDVWHSCRLNTLLGRLLVEILESILVKVDGLGSIARGRRLLDLVVDALEATATNLLRREQLVNSIAVVCLPQVQLLELQRRLRNLSRALIEVAVARCTSNVVRVLRLADLVA